MIVDAEHRGRVSIDHHWIERYGMIVDELSLDEAGIAQIINDINELLA